MSTATSLFVHFFSIATKGRFREVFILTILALIQFTFLIDYLLLMPLGPHLVFNLHMDYQHLSYLISAYTFSAAISGFISSFYVDRFERKKVLIFVYLGFCIGPFLSAISDNFTWLLIARMFSGAFGGVLSALVMIILGDIIPSCRLGRATSYVIAANGLASIIGVPCCMFVVEKLGWQYPFFVLGITSFLLLLIINVALPAIQRPTPIKDPVRSRMVDSLKAILRKKKVVWPMLFMGLLTFAGGFTILPFLSSYMVHNFNFTNADVSFLFFLGGVASFFAGPIAGTLSDKFGKQNIFMLLNFLSIIPILFVTLYPLDSKIFAVIAIALFFMFSTARHVSSMTLINSRYTKNRRGQYIGLNNSVQLISGTSATIVAGQVLYLEEGMLMNFDVLGIIAICAAFLSFFSAFSLEDKNLPPSD